MNRLFGAVPLLILLTSCGLDPKAPSEGNFKKAINQYLEKRGKICYRLNGVFPIDLTASQMMIDSYNGKELNAMAKAGLLTAVETMGVPRNAMPSLFGPRQQKLTRFEPTESGKKYASQVEGVIPQSQMCFAGMAVDRVVKWTEPTKEQNMSEVTYEYKVINVADWAKDPAIQAAMPFVKQTVENQPAPQKIEMQLTNIGWEAM